MEKDSTIGELKLILSERFGITLDHIGVAKPRPYQLKDKDLSSIALLSWDVASNWTITGTPWHLQDGYSIFFILIYSLVIRFFTKIIQK